MEFNSPEKRKKLENLGKELTKIQYDFKTKNETSKNFWIKKTTEFSIYHKKVIEYFSQAYYFINEVDKDQGGLFLLRINKLRQIGEKLLNCMETIMENPEIMNLGNTQKSKWSIEQRTQFLNCSDECLNHERKMNIFFKEFYEKNFSKQ